MILVTGGAGLLGATLIDALLQQGKTVRAIFNKTPLQQQPHPQLQQVHCDILDVVALQEVMQDVRELYHAAGLVSFEQKNAQLLYKINVEGTANVVNAALTAGVRKMVHVSSVAALGRIREGETIHEKMNWTPQTSNSKYGESKYLGEMEVWRGVAEGLEAVVVNPTIILGPGDWNDGSTAIFKSVYNEFPWYANGTTGFVDVRDVVKAMIALMESDVSGERFIISAHNSSYRQVFDMIADAFKKQRPHKEVTPLLAKLVTLYEAVKSNITGKKALITKETAATAQAKVQFNNSKLPQFLPGFTYMGLSIAENEPLDPRILLALLVVVPVLGVGIARWRLRPYAFTAVHVKSDGFTKVRPWDSTDVLFANVKRLNVWHVPYLGGRFVITEESGIKHEFTAALERNEYLLDSLVAARPELIE
ncbi:MAG: NAD-dependent epimerase/dehydratase family protein, partial [Sphingobacteriales bacterium]